MSKSIYITRRIPKSGIELLKSKGYDVDISEKDGTLSKEELLSALSAKEYEAVLCLLTDKINAEIFDSAPSAKIFANYAVGFNNIDLDAARERGITLTNTPGVLTDTVAEHAMSLILSLATRIVEADKFTKEGKYEGWAPMLFLGTDLKGKTLGILGAGRIGSRLAYIAKRGFDMNIVYNDVAPNEYMDKELGAKYLPTTEDVLKEADFISVHVPLLEETRHLINRERLSLMKKTAFVVNTSRGEVIDEKALYEALYGGVIAGAGLDVFENEPSITPGLASLPNVILTPHIASATEETRSKMSLIAAENIIDFLEGREPKNKIK